MPNLQMHMPPSCQHPRSKSDSHCPSEAAHLCGLALLVLLGDVLDLEVCGGKRGRSSARVRSRRFSPPENLLGGRLCLSFSALSESLSTRVYRKRWQRTLNLICWDLLFFLIRAAARKHYCQSSLDHIVSARLNPFATYKKRPSAGRSR